MALMLADYQKEVKGPMMHFDRGRLAELRKGLDEYQALMDSEAAKEGKAEEVFQHRRLLAVAALHLQQQAIPALTEISEAALDVAGADAVKAACSPTKNWNDKIIPSAFTIPPRFSGVVERAKAAVRSLAGH